MATRKARRKPYVLSRRRRISPKRRNKSTRRRTNRRRWPRRKKSRKSGPWKSSRRKRKLRPRSRKNVCIIRFPRRGYRVNCPLMSWCFSRWIRGDIPLSQKVKHAVSFNRGRTYHRMTLRTGKARKKQHYAHRCPDFLRAAIREVISKNRAKWALAFSKRRSCYSDHEIFYKLAKPYVPGSAKSGGSTTNAKTKNVGPQTAGSPQPPVCEPCS